MLVEDVVVVVVVVVVVGKVNLTYETNINVTGP